MEFVNKLREKPAVQRLEKFFPAIAFLGGFAWDSITLGQMVYGSDILILLAYYTGALILVLLLSAQLEHPEGWTPERLQELAKAQAKPKSAAQASATAKQATPSKIEPITESKEESTTAEPPESESKKETEDVVTAQSRFRRAASLIVQKTQAKAKEAANRAALEA